MWILSLFHLRLKRYCSGLIVAKLEVEVAAWRLGSPPWRRLLLLGLGQEVSRLVHDLGRLHLLLGLLLRLLLLWLHRLLLAFIEVSCRYGQLSWQLCRDLYIRVLTFPKHQVHGDCEHFFRECSFQVRIRHLPNLRHQRLFQLCFCHDILHLC